MYHGIIQVGNFAGPGTYLRARIQQYDLDKVIHKGRIWRLVYDGVKPDRSDSARARPHRAAHEQRDAGAARDAPEPSERLVARHGAAAARAQAGQVGRAVAAPDRRQVAEPARALPCDVDARRTGRAQAGARARADGGPRAADAHPGDSRQRDALQGGRPIVCRRLRRDDEGRGRRRRDPGAPHDQPVEGAGRSGDDQDDDGGQRGARRAGRGDHDAQSSGERGRTRPGRFHSRATGPVRSRRTDLQRAVLRVSRHRRDGHTEAGARHHDGAGARGIAARQRPSRLHHQGRAERARRVRSTARPTRT